MGGDDLDELVLGEEYIVSGDESAEPSDQENQDEGTPSEQSAAARKRKRREKNKERKAKRQKLIGSSNSEQQSIAQQAPSQLAEYLHSVQARSFPKLSALELEDLRIPESSIADTTGWTDPRTLDHLTDFIIEILPNLHTRLGQKSKNPGSPTLLFITGAALRVADVTRILKDKRLRDEKGGEVAKLFARHFKLAEHSFYLKRTKIGAAVGTPGRIWKLLSETDALTISALSHIILDMSYRDAKRRHLFDIPETRDDVFKLLGSQKTWEAIKVGKIQVVLF
ncbi:hypothetical protein D9757_002080 [Collybiopsis confluens]|uniref:U3-containing 90S pre-ribosomal complex subunit-domain containing protein n=1 Tax=Collybiopsis confluens TaxID=2823264 RepID=A0A8H5MEQ8_9AGAR|nr:hypothetical protein D9757_002080 [Collybiopsis confluens]